MFGPVARVDSAYFEIIGEVSPENFPDFYEPSREIAAWMWNVCIKNRNQHMPVGASEECLFPGQVIDEDLFQKFDQFNNTEGFLFLRQNLMIQICINPQTWVESFFVTFSMAEYLYNKL